MPRKTMVEAIRDAMNVCMERDDNVVVFGEDVGYFGGVFRCTEGLQAKYGKTRVFDTPISEGGIVGVAVGMGAYGLRPAAEILQRRDRHRATMDEPPQGGKAYKR
jgi:2-oxoisovalerate dehydrogenase E1 component beta subunit